MGRLSVTGSTIRSMLLLIVATTTALLTGCANTPEYNPTVFNAQISETDIAQAPLKKVVIASINLGTPSRQYFKEHEPIIDAKVARYLSDNGVEVIEQANFTRAYNTAVRAYGNPVDPSTGKVNRKAYSLVMQNIRDRLRETTDVDAIVFTDIVETQVPFNIGLKHLARWDGVTRKPVLQGPGNTVSTEFNWEEPARVSSLMIAIYDMRLKRLFLGRGGLSATDAVDTRASGQGFMRRRELLTSEQQIAEGIALALHPLIVMDNWPGETP